MCEQVQRVAAFHTLPHSPPLLHAIDVLCGAAPLYTLFLFPRGFDFSKKSWPAVPCWGDFGSVFGTNLV